MAMLMHLTKTNGEMFLIGLSAIKMVEHTEYTPEVPRVDAKAHPDHRPVLAAVPGPTVGSKITLMDGKEIVVRERVHAISDMQ